MMDPALQGSMLATMAGIITLVVSRIRCVYKRDQEGNCGPCICGCTEKSIQESHDEVDVREVSVGGVDAILLLPRS